MRQLCHRSIWLDRGEVRLDGPTAEVVNRYLEHHVGRTSAGAWIDLREAHRSGSGEARFEGARFEAPDDPQGTPRSGHHFAVEFNVACQQPVAVGSLSVRVSIPGGPVLVSADPVIEGDLALELEPGDHRLRIDIESLNLAPGSYMIGLRLARGLSGRGWSLFDSIEDAIHLDLEPDAEVPLPRGQAIVPCTSTLTNLGQRHPRP